ncbi:MAG TPA: hypothetical protein VFN09_07885 [Rhodanobacteraceae bacterium]|nr:hypothetical protein [Rhodanobacteraceae bacterium]
MAANEEFGIPTLRSRPWGAPTQNLVARVQERPMGAITMHATVDAVDRA